MDTNTAAEILANVNEYGLHSPDRVIAACDVAITSHLDNWKGSLAVARQLRDDGATGAEIAEWGGYALESYTIVRELRAFKLAAGAQWVFTGAIRTGESVPSLKALVASRCDNYRRCGHFPA